MLKSIVIAAALLVSAAAGLSLLNQTAPSVQAHCQVPCGIFDEDARLKALYEDAATIEKAMNLMNELAGKTDAQSQQQFIRWTITKEEHAERIITVTSAYFLAQRLKPVAPGDEGYDEYLRQLAQHHSLIIAAMKSKQTTETDVVVTLRDAIHDLEHIWSETHDH
ncbi:MAG: superoxide dismutase [Ni] [Planctomycetota bacterium]